MLRPRIPGRQLVQQRAQPQRRRAKLGLQRAAQPLADLAADSPAIDAVDLDSVEPGGIRHDQFHSLSAAVSMRPPSAVGVKFCASGTETACRMRRVQKDTTSNKQERSATPRTRPREAGTPAGAGWASRICGQWQQKAAAFGYPRVRSF